MNRRQWRHRVLHAKCWRCDVPLVAVEHALVRRCPTCGSEYPEAVRLGYVWDIRHSIDGFGKEFWLEDVARRPPAGLMP